jgi:hypothetical protein
MSVGDLQGKRFVDVLNDPQSNLHLSEGQLPASPLAELSEIRHLAPTPLQMPECEMARFPN